MQQKQFWLSVSLIFSVLFNAMPLPAQIKTTETRQTFEIKLPSVSEPKEVFRAFLQSGRNEAFSQLLKRVGGKSHTENLESTFETESVNLFGAINAASANSLPLVAEKAKEISQRKYEELKKNPPKTPQTNKSVRRRGGPGFEDEFDFESEIQETKSDFSSRVKFPAGIFIAEEEPIIEKVETDTGIQITGSASKTTELAEATVTRTENVDNKFYYDGKSMTIENIRVVKTEAVSQIENEKITNTQKLKWGSSFDICPDANGIVRGTLKAQINNQLVFTKGKEIAALTDDLNIEFKVTGYVNEDAQMTHFDMEGQTIDTMIGYDRAKQRDLVRPRDEFSDGTNRIKYEVKNSKPPYKVDDGRGGKDIVKAQYGSLEGFLPTNVSTEKIKRINEFTQEGFQMSKSDLTGLIQNSIYRWQNNECVDVECTAAKNTLTPGEHIDVNAVSISKLDLSKFNAKLESTGSESVTPKDQFGKPKAVYQLTATGDGTADILVKSTSRRGIGTGMLEFGKSWQEYREICDGNWHGIVEIHKSFEDTQKETTNPGDMKARPHLSGSSETIKRRKYEGSVKIGRENLATANVLHLNATYMVSAEVYSLDHGYFLDPGECGWNKPTTARDESGTELKENYSGEGTTDMSIQIYGDNYRGNLTIPKINGTYFRRVWRTPTGYCQPANNIPSDTTENGQTFFDSVAISFEGKIDPKQPDALTGIKTITSTDGKETTIITWRLKRCFPAKANTKSSVKK